MAIKVLSQDIANLIAAGEVVERPLSVIKELVENSIDAGADNITVEIQRGGVSFIRVTDNGCGMSREDLEVCILRHATSKIKEASDLNGIMTLGFRGEALAATAAVSKFRIMTKRAEDENGYILSGEYGKVEDISEAGCVNGTTIIIEQLFGNVPARRKFLKRDASEAAAALGTVEKVALSKPHIAFKFISDGEIKFETTGDGALENAVYSVLGRDFARKIIKVNGTFESVSVQGYIGTPENVRTNRLSEIYFINGRYVRSTTVSAALEQAFKSYIPENKFPVCVLNINLHPAFVDVNVHPTKMEVKFSDSRPVFDSIYCTVKNALKNDLTTPEILTPEEVKKENRNMVNSFIPIFESDDRNTEGDGSGYTMMGEDSNKKNHLLDREERNISSYGSVAESIPSSYKSEPFFGVLHEKREDQKEDTEETEEREYKNTPEISATFFRVVGEIFHAFIIVELDEKIMAIDKHAAHERILFEKMKKNFDNKEKQSQMLLIPLEIRLTPDEVAALNEYREEVCSLGYDFEIADDCVTVTESPAHIGSAAAEELIRQIAYSLSMQRSGAENIERDIYEKALFTASCKAATKAGWVDSDEEIKDIVLQVLTNPGVRYCPHGRPVAFEIGRGEIERRFERS